MSTQDSTVAARIPIDLREDLERVVELRRERGELRLDGAPIDLSTIIRRELRNVADRDLGRAGGTGQPIGPHAQGAGLFANTADGAARSSDPATSKAAARDVAPRAGSQRRRALALIVAHGDRGATVDELLDYLERGGVHVAVNGFARRVTDLLQAGAIRELAIRLGRNGWETDADDPDHRSPELAGIHDSDRAGHATRPTRHGSAATVYVATAKGREWLNANRSEATRA